MKLMKAAIALALATGLAGASSAFAGAPDERELWEMLKKSAEKRADGMATKTDSMKMEKPSGAMDKSGKAMLSAEEIARILDPNVANP